MAKDSYDYIAFRILTYYYAVFKNKIAFNEQVLKEHIITNEVDPTYLSRILRSMQEEGYMRGLVFANTWGGEYILIGDLRNAEITVDGIRYLENNSAMKTAREFAEKAGGLILKLIPIAF